jgi:3'(2'), 5'-bisphosphate nucleotidase
LPRPCRAVAAFSPLATELMLTKGQIEFICEVAQAAGREVMDVYAREHEAEIKADGSPLTQADLRSDRVIRDRLQAAFPDIPIVSEESACAQPGAPATFFLVDPLDGTKEFLQRNGEFTVNIALIHRQEPVAGVVLAPALGDIFYAARGVGAWTHTEGRECPLKTALAAPGAPLRVLGSRSHGNDAVGAWLARLGRPYRLEVAGSSLKFCRIAQGLADLYPRFGPTCQWDTAAGQAVLEGAGGAVLAGNGQALRYGLELPNLNPHFVALADPDFPYPSFV